MRRFWKIFKNIFKEPKLLLLITLYTLLYSYILSVMFLIILYYIILYLLKIIYYYYLSGKNKETEYIIKLNIWNPTAQNIYKQYLWLFFYLKPYLLSRFYIYKLFTIKKNIIKTTYKYLLFIVLKFLLHYIYILITGLTKTFLKYLMKLYDFYWNIKSVEMYPNKSAFIQSYLQKYWTDEMTDLFAVGKIEIKIKNKTIDFIML